MAAVAERYLISIQCCSSLQTTNPNSHAPAYLRRVYRQDQHVTIAKGCADYALSVFVKKVKSRLERDAAALLEKGNDAAGEVRRGSACVYDQCRFKAWWHMHGCRVAELVANLWINAIVPTAVLPKPFVDLFNEVDWSATEAGLKITHVLSTTVGCMMWDDKKKQSKAFCTVLAAGDKLPGGRKLDPMEVPSKEEGSAIINLEEHGECVFIHRLSDVPVLSCVRFF